MQKNYVAYLQCFLLLYPFGKNLGQNTPSGITQQQLTLNQNFINFDLNTKINYIRVREARKAVPNPDPLSFDNNLYFKQAVTYTDGLGRPIQMVVKGNNYDGTKDIVSTYAYDEFGRESRQYLPYAPLSGSNGRFRVNAFAEQSAYYHTVYQDQTPFSKSDFDGSPLNSVLASYAPGNSWAGSNRGVTKETAVNKISDSVQIAEIGFANGALPVFIGFYAQGELIKTTTTDEDGKVTVEYKNREGKAILVKRQHTTVPGAAYSGWLCTFFIYDELGQLRVVIQPRGVEQLVATGWQSIASFIDEFCFINEYDSEGRTIYKKIPGAAPVYMCYDKRSRLVYTQDGNLRNQNKWTVIFYDEVNRQAGTALLSTNQTRAQLQSELDAISTDNPVPVIPENLLTRLSYIYYDEYTMPGTAVYNQAMVNTAQSNISSGDEVMENLSKTELTRGMVTATQARVINTSLFIKNTIYYDTRNRTLQTLATNHKGGTDAATFVYSFTGKILSGYLVHNNPAASLPNTQSVQVYTRNTYNNDYLLKSEKKVNNGIWERIVEMEYDDMGKPRKKLMGQPSSNFYVDFDYNIRGWVTGINKTAQQSLENGTIGMTSFYQAIFSEIVNYDYGYQKKYYNGNISGIRSANASDKQARSYGYFYDNTNRLTQADFTQKNGNAWNTGQGIDYSLTGMGYDANGNITRLAQNALKFNSSAQVDDLAYIYQSNSNKLLKVIETAPGSTQPGTSSGLGDFKDGTNAGNDYTYDTNGNMSTDANKNLGGIVYNHLNLPQTIAVTGKGTIEYLYDVNGNKLQKKVTEGAQITTTDYVCGFVYNNNELQYINHDEGRIRYVKKYFLNGDSAYTWQYDFFYKDHLGNVRAEVTEQADTAKYMATFELDYRPKETALFHKIPETAVPIEGIAGYPGDTQSGTYTSKLNGENARVGASITLKVMAGDKVDLAVKNWYALYSGGRDREPVRTENILNTLIGSLTGDASSLSSGKASQAELNQPGIVPAAIQNFLNTQSNEPIIGGRPNAYLNWILMDEQFKFVPEGSGYIRVDQHSSTYLLTTAITALQVPKSGYLYVYVSNETRGINVYFDNLVVQHYTGPLSGTTDYTPWGLSMKMLESRAFGRLENKLQFNGKEKQGKEFGDGSGLEWMDYGARMYDAQISKWMLPDPLAANYYPFSPYTFSADNPVNFIDDDGRKIKPAKSFIASPYYSVYKSLCASKSSAYLTLLNQYQNSSSYNFNLHYTSNRQYVKANDNARTHGVTKSDGTTGNNTSIESNSYYNESKYSTQVGEKTFVRTEIAMAGTLLHEAVHANITAGRKKFTDNVEDNNHNDFSKKQPLVLQGLKEYNQSNNLGYTDQQLADISWEGARDSKEFKKYIAGLAQENHTTPEDELKKYDKRMYSLLWTEQKTQVNQ